MKDIIELIRALQRPLIALTVIGVIAYLGVRLVGQFATAEMARDVVIFILGAGSMIIGVLFGERSVKTTIDTLLGKKKEER